MSSGQLPPDKPNPFADAPPQPQPPVNPYAAPQVIDAPGAAWAMTPSPGLQQVATGLGLVYYGIVAVLLGVIVGAIGPMFVGRGMPNANAMLVVLLFAGLLALAGYVLMFIGPIFCLAVPAESGSKPLIVSSVVLMIISFVGAIANLFTTASPALSLLVNIVGMVSLILFLLFIKKLAQFIGRPDIAQFATVVLVINVVTILLAVVFVSSLATAVGLAGRMADGRGAFVGLLGLAVLVMAVVWIIVYSRLLLSARKALLRQP